jgi:hypothetical protein
MLTRNNRGIVMIAYIMRTAVAMEQLSKHISAKKKKKNAVCAAPAEEL